jgi:hypothetical protein
MAVLSARFRIGGFEVAALSDGTGASSLRSGEYVSRA